MHLRWLNFHCHSSSSSFMYNNCDLFTSKFWFLRCNIYFRISQIQIHPQLFTVFNLTFHFLKIQWITNNFDHDFFLSNAFYIPKTTTVDALIHSSTQKKWVIFNWDSLVCYHKNTDFKLYYTVDFWIESEVSKHRIVILLVGVCSSVCAPTCRSQQSLVNVRIQLNRLTW